MRHKKLKLMVVLLFGLGLTNVQAQTMFVNESSGTQTEFALSNIQRMTFSEGSTSIQKADNSIVSISLSEINSINFEGPFTSFDEHISLNKNTRLTAYPNPVNDVLSIDLSSLKNKQGTLSVLSLDGSTILTQQTQSTTRETINLGGLPTGIYYCQFINDDEIKTVKIIKD